MLTDYCKYTAFCPTNHNH